MRNFYLIRDIFVGLIFLVSVHPTEAVGSITSKCPHSGDDSQVTQEQVAKLLELQTQNRLLFYTGFLPRMRNVKTHSYFALPTGIRPDMRTQFQALFELTKNGFLVFELLQGLEKEVIQFAQTNELFLEDAFLHILGSEERRFGFAAAVRVTTYLSQTDFMKLLFEGHPIADDYWLGKPHTRDGHRVQSIIEARYLEQKFNNTELYVPLYREMGNISAIHKLDWSGTGLNVSFIDPADPKTFPDLWAFLHDTPFFTDERFRWEPNDFTNPDFFGELRKYLPGLVGWK